MHGALGTALGNYPSELARWNYQRVGIVGYRWAYLIYPSDAM